MKKLTALILVTIFTLGVLRAQDDSIAAELDGQQLITFLQDNYSVSTSLSYNGARDYMFQDFDTLNGGVRGVYSGYTYTYSGSPDRIEAQENGFNTEHTWPQSFFDQDLPMRSDIHHLFITRVDVNGARSNFRFDEIPDQQTSTWYRLDQNQSSIPTSNIDEYSELLSNTSFEPREDFKGNIARAIYYFWTVYQDDPSITGDATNNAAFFEEMKPVLLEWHDMDPVDQREVERSLDIEGVQGNRNPFIHDTTLVRRAYYGASGVSIEEPDALPSGIRLDQNYPNPFNPVTNIPFSLDQSRKVSLKVYSRNGKLVQTITEQSYPAGNHTVRFDASGLSSGVYYYILKAGSQQILKKMTLIK
ncbi:endonuclease [Balneola sp. MJW-20]|uniref:endonuclease n=1 Tax=Gracilimonas aurantiaca TaxID=3234185 RepID=UPI003465EE64